MQIRPSMLRHTAIFCFFTAISLAQPQPAFEVASIRPTPLSNSGAPIRIGSLSGGPDTKDPTRITGTRVPLSLLVQTAYDIPAFRCTCDRLLGIFDIAATLAEGTTHGRYLQMLQNLLTERFHLKHHWETRESTTYQLGLAKDGSKLTPSTGPPDLRMTGAAKIGPDGFPNYPRGVNGTVRMRPGQSRMYAADRTMADLANQLQTILKAPVTDATHLTGAYDFQLDFDDQLGPPAEDPFPILPVALSQQLGLRLEKDKGPVKYLVVDSVDKLPTEN